MCGNININSSEYETLQLGNNRVNVDLCEDLDCANFVKTQCLLGPKLLNLKKETRMEH